MSSELLVKIDFAAKKTLKTIKILIHSKWYYVLSSGGHRLIIP